MVLHFNCRRYKEKREDAAEPEVDPERDQRTVFAYQVTHICLSVVSFVCLYLLLC